MECVSSRGNVDFCLEYIIYNYMYAFAYTLELQDILLTSDNTEVTNTAPTQAEVKYEADSVKIQHSWRKYLFSIRIKNKKCSGKSR